MRKGRYPGNAKEKRRDYNSRIRPRDELAEPQTSFVAGANQNPVFQVGARVAFTSFFVSALRLPGKRTQPAGLQTRRTRAQGIGAARSVEVVRFEVD